MPRVRLFIFRSMISIALVAGAFLLAIPTAAQKTVDKAAHVGLPVDWSHGHVAVTGGATLAARLSAARDPRMRSVWLTRARRSFPNSRGFKKKALQIDWSVPLGGGNVAPTMSPAKYTFDVNATPNCASDYVVMGLNVPGVNGKPAATIAGTGVPGASRNGTTSVVTITTTSAHGFSAGQGVVISGVSNTSFNGAYVIASVPTSTTFTYTQAGATATSGNGSATVNQANLIAFNNLYSGTAGGTGLCGSGAASVMWAYNVSSAGGSILTSPSISLDGKKIAFVESAASSSIFRVLTYDPCTVSTSQCAGNGTTATTPVAPGTGNAASMSSPITYASVTNTRSSPWIDYRNDAAYVGADNATIYRITGVFNGTPTLDTSFGTSPGVPGITLSNNCASAAATPAKLTGPVQVLGATGGLDTGFLFIGDDTGCLTAIDVATRTVVGSVTVGGNVVGSFVPAVYDPPIVDASNPNLLSVFAVSSSSNNATSFGGVSVQGSAALIQAELDTTVPSFTAVSGVPIGNGATSSVTLDLHMPAFDNNYYSNNITVSTGFIYACGTQPSSSSAPEAPTLYRVGFGTPPVSPPLMNTAVDGTPLLIDAVNGHQCSPLLEVENPSLTTTDLLFLSNITTNGVLSVLDITAAMPSGSIAAASVKGGASGMVMDNTQLTTQQGSSLYFSTQLNGTSGACVGVKCAVKLTQAALQ